ncbi:hypothetical protein D3C83_328250 [compost metagenome]
MSVEHPARQVGEAVFCSHLRRQLRPVEPQLGLGATAEELGQQALIAGGGFPRHVARRIADMVLP